MSEDTRNNGGRGRVVLIGAGPGDPGLMTVRGLEALRAADVVVFDALVDPMVLGKAAAGADRINVGKRAGKHRLNQDQINRCLLDQARMGRLVARLKGGDPYLFGRGAEEVAYLAQHGVACEVIPGVTAGIAVPMAVGIPVTHRKVSSTVSFVTGHEDPAKGESAIDYRALAGLVGAGGTVCFYMGIVTLGSICRQLISNGLAESVPVAVIQWGTTPRQRHVRTTLGTAVGDVQAAGIGAPSIIVVGAVVGLDEPGLVAAAGRPLLGRRIVITRTRTQASQLRTKLADLGAQVTEAPTIELARPADWGPVDKVIREVGKFDWVVLTSGNAVEALAERMGVLGLDARHFSGVRFAAIGAATRRALRDCTGIRADAVPERSVAESLAALLIDEHAVAGKQVLLLRADIARPVLPRLLTAGGARVTDVAVYETKRPDALPADALRGLGEGAVDWVTFTSSSTARNMIEMLPGGVSDLAQVRVASIGPITSRTLRELGIEPTIEAETSDIDGLVGAIVRQEL